ncbi:MAG: hypothetical protein HYY28_10390 [Betaproteobacteria bacterium]|nr:hypothetical protein [Betaproteobacteria bacterium]
MPTTLPQDLYPDSLNRLPMVKREELDEQGKRALDAVLDPRARSVAGLQGPGGIWMHSPKIAEVQREFIRLLRQENGFGDRLTELAILLAARETNHQFEWTVHEPVALKAGLERQIVDVVKYRGPTEGLPKTEKLIIDFGRQLLREKKVDQPLYAETERALGRTGIVNLAGLIGYYAMTGIILNAFDQHLKPGLEPLLPMP